MPAKPTKDDTDPKPDTGPQQMMDDAAALQAYGFNTMTSMGVAWVEALSDMGSEVLSFVADRIKEDVKTQHRLLHCKDVDELQEIQAEFVQKAIDQYRDETGKLVEMSRNFASKAEADRGKT